MSKGRMTEMDILWISVKTVWLVSKAFVRGQSCSELVQQFSSRIQINRKKYFLFNWADASLLVMMVIIVLIIASQCNQAQPEGERKKKKQSRTPNVQIRLLYGCYRDL